MAIGQTTGDFVARRRELRALDAALPADGPDGIVVAISGDPGIGKTTLLGEVMRRADAAGRLVLAGRAAELERDRPFGVIVEAVDDHVARLRRPELASIGPEAMTELARVLPSIADRANGSAGGAVQDERYRAYRAMRELFERLAITRPVTLILDDMHWADPASIELVSHLLSRGPGRNVLLVLAYRTGQVAPRVATALQAAEREQRATLLELDPFTREDVDEWLGNRVRGDARESLFELSGGNPFYLDQLVRNMDSNATRLTAGRATVPAGVRAAIEAELDTLDEATRLVLQGGAVAGDPFEPDIAAAAADVSENDALAALDVLLERRLVLSTAVQTRFGFRHPIVREAVYETSGGGWRITAHHRAAAALETRGAPAAQRAHHIERSAKPGDTEAVALLASAANEARPRAPATAARWLESALRLLPADAADQRLGLLVVRALALASAGELAASRDVALEALGQAPPDAPGLRAQLVTLVAGVELLLGQNAAAHARLHTAFEAVPDQTSADAAALALQLAYNRSFVSDWDAALAWARKAATLTQAIPERVLRASAVGTLATCEALAGVADRPGSHVDAATKLLDDLSDDELAARVETTFNTGYAEFFYDGYDAAFRHQDRGLAVSRATGQGHIIVPLLICQALVLERQGRLRESLDRAEAATEAAELGGMVLWQSWGGAWASWLHAQMGDFTASMKLGEAALAMASDHESFVHSAATGWVFGAALVEAGEVERGAQLMTDLGGGPELPQLIPHARNSCYELLAIAALQRDAVDIATDWVERAEDLARRLPVTNVEALAKRARAELALATGGTREAADLALASAALSSSIGQQLETARAHLLAGRALAEHGDATAATEQLERAEAGAAACGAEPLRRRAAGALRALGKRPPTRAAAATGDNGDAGALASLTPRQREIARLVAEGRTNREIAGVLFLTEKTVENHLARTFVRVGVTSRAALAAAITREDPSPG